MANNEFNGADAYEVGGFRSARPFRIRRLGHFGYNVEDVAANLAFYRDVLGLRVSDRIDYRELTAEPQLLDGLGDPYGYFMRHGTDHHSFVLFNRRVREALDKAGRFRRGVTSNQITWQVDTLAEVVAAVEFLSARGVRMIRSGRDTPGSNWHTYVLDPDGHTVEIYYGIEQIGWNGRSKPKAMYYRGHREAPSLPQIPESAEVVEALARGVNIDGGYRDEIAAPASFDLGGVSAPRPFAVTGIGPVRLFVADVDVAREFYAGALGLAVTEERSVLGERAIFLRAGAEHHSLALYAIGLREQLPIRQDTTSLSFGLRVGSYQQLRQAVEFMVERGSRLVALPAELSPGTRHHAFIADPDGHLVELYCEMDIVGWDGRPRSPALLPTTPVSQWPRAIDPATPTLVGEPYLGPLL